MSKFTAVVKTLAAAAAVVAVSAANATPIIGSASMGLGAVEVTPLNIDWNQGTLNTPPNAVQTYGGFTAYLGTGSLAGVTTSPATGLIQDMSDFAAIGSPDANQVNIGANNIANFLQFAAEPGWLFTLTSLAAGSVVDGLTTPYQLTQQGGSTIAQITLSGTVCDASSSGGVCVAGDDVTQWVATLSATYAGYTVDGLEAAVAAGTAPNTNWSGNLTASVIPEPGSLALVGLALAGVGFVARRRKA